MKHFFKNICMIVLTLFFLILLFKDPSISKESITVSFNLWINNLVPSIFPMIIINDILINYNFPIIVCSVFYKFFNNIFKLSYNGTYFFVMSLFVGTPTNAILLKDMINKELINIDEANKLIYTCYFSNPLFLFNMLNILFDIRISIKIIIIHYISNFILLFFIRNKYTSYIDNHYQINHENIGKLIIKTCNKAINSLITILGIISFYMIITNYINIKILNGLFEITNGLNSLIHLNIKHKDIFSIILVNFGGLSIFSQIKSILEDTQINFMNYFKGRFFQIIFSIILYSI
ncbi:MAG: hypothetical protein E7158_06155 [Firmicutes bacterium]|nr:hypothetical protein [Bacillota bacterium]